MDFYLHTNDQISLYCFQAFHCDEIMGQMLYQFQENQRDYFSNDTFRGRSLVSCADRRRWDLGDICFIKDEEGRTITDEEKIKKRWGEYFSSLFNAREREGHKEGVGPSRQPHPECYYSRISQAEVRTSLQKTGINKVVGPDQIPIEACRSLEDEGTFWLTSLFNKIFISAKMPEEWRLSEVILIFNNKGDAQVFSNYKGIKLLGHTMKLLERVIERRLRRETSVSKNQFCFMPGRSSVKAIHLIISLMEKYRERQRDLHMTFLDLEKAYDSEDIPWCLIFTDDIVLVSESTEGLNIRLENWKEVLEDYGPRISREKTEYLRCDFSNDRCCTNFRRINEDVSNRIKAVWMKWRAATRFFGDINVPLKLKGKFYRVIIRPAMLYGSECWPITKALTNRVEVAKLRMLRWTCGKTLLDMILNGVYRAQLEAEMIINKMREGRLRWSGHVRRRPQSAPVRRVEALVVDGLRRRGRPKLRWEDRVK
ncbi:retrovirus-related pol polyprotein LINE-1 [Tanacetum coccineum]